MDAKIVLVVQRLEPGLGALEPLVPMVDPCRVVGPLARGGLESLGVRSRDGSVVRVFGSDLGDDRVLVAQLDRTLEQA